MTIWQVHRRRCGWQLQRSDEGLARLVDPFGVCSAPTSIGKALADLAQQTRASSHRHRQHVIFVHGLMGEREDFCDLQASFCKLDWDLEFFRYASHGARFDHHVRALQQRIDQSRRRADRLCLIGHSFGCRLIASACKAVTRTTLDIVFLAPPVSRVRWAQRGAAFAPVKAFLGGSLQELADHPLEMDGLSGHRLLVVEGRSKAHSDGWLKSSETLLPFAHRRQDVKANHSDIVSSTQTTAAVHDFLIKA